MAESLFLPQERCHLPADSERQQQDAYMHSLEVENQQLKAENAALRLALEEAKRRLGLPKLS